MSDSLRTVILQELKSKFPFMTWKLGSLVRELVVEPLASLGDVLDAYVQQAEAGLDVLTICQSPSQYHEEITAWVNRLGLSETTSRASTGIVAILSSTGESMTIDEGTFLSWRGDISLRVVRTYTFDEDHPYTKLGEDSFLAEIEVESSGADGVAISLGAPLGWEGAPDHVYDIYTASPISGGAALMSDQAKAELILNALSPASFTGDMCISQALKRNFPSDVVNAKTVKKTADAPYNVNLYIKPSTPPTSILLASNAFLEDSKVKVTIPGVGLLSVNKVVNSLNAVCPIVSMSVDGSIGDSGSSVTLEIQEANPGDELSIYCTGFKVLSDCAYWLNAEQQGLPFNYIVKVPAVATIGISLNTSETVPTNVKIAIQQYINDKPLDTAVTDSEISAILQQYNIPVTGSHLYTATLSNATGAGSLTTSVGGVSPSGSIWAVGRPVAMYNYTDMTVTNV